MYHYIVFYTYSIDTTEGGFGYGNCDLVVSQKINGAVALRGIAQLFLDKQEGEPRMRGLCISNFILIAEQPVKADV